MTSHKEIWKSYKHLKHEHENYRNHRSTENVKPCYTFNKKLHNYYFDHNNINNRKEGRLKVKINRGRQRTDCITNMKYGQRNPAFLASSRFPVNMSCFLAYFALIVPCIRNLLALFCILPVWNLELIDTSADLIRAKDIRVILGSRAESV